jgi:hypothetical protein
MPPDLEPILSAAFPGCRVALVEGEHGWTAATLYGPDSSERLRLSRHRRDDPGVRGELQSWAAWVESCGGTPVHERLMERIIQTQQVVLLEDSLVAKQAAAALCRAVDGLMQMDGIGFVDNGGSILLPEDASEQVMS